MISFISSIFNFFPCFWRRNPALLYGFSLLIGISISHYQEPFLLVFIPILLFSKEKSFLVMTLLLASIFFLTNQIKMPDLKNEGISGTAHFEISSMQIKTSHIGKTHVYKGRIKEFFPFHTIKNIPVALSIPAKKDILRPPGNCSYLVEGNLKELENKRYAFILNKNCLAWQPVAGSFSFSEARYIVKKKLKKIIRKKIKDEKSASFLSGITTGEFDDLSLSFHFSRFGLQHIMAISGFHFAILATILRFFLQLFLSKRNVAITLVFLLTSYFIFLGFAASILRAWIMISISLLSTLIEKPLNAINSMGIALITVLLIDPLSINNLGFQFSFGVTFSILMFFSKTDDLLRLVFKKRLLKNSLKMNVLNQYGLILLGFIREAFALSIAVNLVALPLTLYHFGKFPLLSILYNFFFPFMASISMLLLLLSFLLPFSILDVINNYFTKFLLEFASEMPQTADLNLYVHSIPFELIVVYFFFLFCFGIFCFKEKYPNSSTIVV